MKQKTRPIESWITPEKESIKFPNFERNVLICILIGVFAILAAFAYVAYRIDKQEKAREQYRLEQEAIKSGHAIEVIP